MPKPQTVYARDYRGAPYVCRDIWAKREGAPIWEPISAEAYAEATANSEPFPLAALMWDAVMPTIFDTWDD